MCLGRLFAAGGGCHRRSKAVEGIRPYLIENAFRVPFPQPFSYNMWQPWVMNTFGEGGIPAMLKYYWVDQDLKSLTVK